MTSRSRRTFSEIVGRGFAARSDLSRHRQRQFCARAIAGAGRYWAFWSTRRWNRTSSGEGFVPPMSDLGEVIDGFEELLGPMEALFGDKPGVAMAANDPCGDRRP